MPHFLASHITLPPMPFTQEGYTFVYEAKQCNDSSQSLILVRYEDNEFFLRKAWRGNKNNAILKCEKSTKTQPTGIIKNALKILCAYQKNVISHNLNKNTPRQNLQSPYFQPMDFFLDFAKPCLIEIGFGSGRHLLHLAQSNPHLMCIGIEIHTPSIEQILRQVQLLGLENLYIINGDARILLEILSSHIAQGIYVHFPVPWNKKHHRRIFSPKFFQESLRVLDNNGVLHLRSDDEIYFQDALSLALQQESISLEIHKNQQEVITSKYEARWKKQQKNIYDLKIFHTYKNTNNEKNVKNTQKNFYFDKILRKNLDNYKNFPHKKIANDWFLHIDNLYCAGDIYVLALCFGDFNQPQSKFLQIEFCNNVSAQYIGSNPIPTQAAIKAHKYLIQILTQE